MSIKRGRTYGQHIDDGRWPYKTKYVCFNCRKVFRSQDRSLSLTCCPDCRGNLWSMGQVFKAPRKRKKQDWKRIQKHVCRRRDR